MAKLCPVDFEVEIRCPQTGGKWVGTSIWYHATVVEETAVGYQEVSRFEDFDALYEYVKGHHIRNCEAYTSIFRNPVIECTNVTQFSKEVIHKRGFKWFEIRRTFAPHPEWSMEYLMKNLSSEDFIRYIQSRGLEIGG